MSNKKCPVTRAEFAKCEDLTLVLDGQKIVAKSREFSSGSLGWYATGKAVVLINGKPVMCQIGANITVIGSKDLPADEGGEAAQGE